jgi:hypothetical protein
MNKADIKRLLSGFKKDYQPLADAFYDLLQGDQGTHLIDVLKTYQNSDGGFGHGLEADIQMPYSSVAATNLAITFLDQVPSSAKDDMIKESVRYYESVFDNSTLSFEMVPPEVDTYPHAVWWNYADLSSFTYGNPNPEILGTLLKYKKNTSIHLDAFQHKVLSYIEKELPKTDQFHVLLSVLHLYERGGKSIRNRLDPMIRQACDNMVEQDPRKWGEYGLEPYKVFLTAPSLFGKTQPGLEQSITHLEGLLELGPIRPNWSWYQYDEIFQEIVDHWSILLTYDAIRAIQVYRKQ